MNKNLYSAKKKNVIVVMKSDFCGRTVVLCVQWLYILYLAAL